MLFAKQIILYCILLNICDIRCINFRRFGTSLRRIVGGERGKAEDWPFTVALFTNVEQVGAGSLISSDCVLTAAHVFTNDTEDGHGWIRRNPEEFYIKLGSTRIDKGYTQMDIKKIFIHPNYTTDDNFHDIAIVILEKPVHFSSLLNITKLAAKTPKPGTRCKIAGWGETLQKNPQDDYVFIVPENMSLLFPQELQEVQLPVIDHEECEHLLFRALQLVTPKMDVGTGNIISNNVICTLVRSGGMDACQGDSGGPLVCNGLLSGITSWGQGCALPNTPAVFTDVSKYLSWIEGNCKSFPSKKPNPKSKARNTPKEEGIKSGKKNITDILLIDVILIFHLFLNMLYNK